MNCGCDSTHTESISVRWRRWSFRNTWAAIGKAWWSSSLSGYWMWIKARFR